MVLTRIYFKENFALTTTTGIQPDVNLHVVIVHVVIVHVDKDKKNFSF